MFLSMDQLLKATPMDLEEGGMEPQLWPMQRHQMIC